jgi:hypothetical protein
MRCTARGRCFTTDGRSWRATGWSLAGQAVEPGRRPTPDSGHGRAHPCADTGRSHRTPDTGHRTPESRTPDTGHRTPDAWTRGRVDADRGRGQGGQGAAGIRTSWSTTTTRLPAGTPNRVPVDGACGARNHDGSAVRHLPARDTAYRTTRQLLGRSVGQAAPRRTAVLGRFRVESRASGSRSSVMAGASWAAEWRRSVAGLAVACAGTRGRSLRW